MKDLLDHSDNLLLRMEMQTEPLQVLHVTAFIVDPAAKKFPTSVVKGLCGCYLMYTCVLQTKY